MIASLLPAAAPLLLVALAALVLIKESGQGRAPLAFSLMLLALVELFEAIALRGAGQPAGSMRLVLVCKSLLPATLLLYGVCFTRRGSAGSPVIIAAPLLVTAGIFVVAALLLPMGLFYAGLDAATGRYLVFGGIGYWFYLGLMIFCIAALVNLESVFAGTRGADRWRVKYEFLGVGAILAVMIFYFSQGLLYRAADLHLLPVRSGVVVLSSLLIAYSRLYRGRRASFTVSRQAFYRSVTLLAVGLYLLLLGILGEGIRRFDFPMGRNWSVFIAIFGSVVFLMLLLSEEIRRRVRNFIAKHFYAQKHDYRDKWLAFSNALVTCRTPGEVHAAVTERYQAIFGPRFAALYTRDGTTDNFSLAAARDTAGAPAHVTFTRALLGYFAETGRVLNPQDGEYTPEQVEADFIREIGAWLVVPLMAAERLEAFLVLGRQIAPEKLTYEDFDLMKLLGRQAVLSMKNFQLAEELTEAREMAAVAKVSSFVIHDLKNLAYTFSLMMENAEEHIAEADFQKDLVGSIRSTVGKMNNLIAKLRSLPSRQELQTGIADVAELARETVAEVGRLKPAVTITQECAPGQAILDAREMKKVVLNLLLNACDASGDGGRLTVRTGRRGSDVFLSVEDNGCGMSPSFVENQLFRPFRTTKEKGLGIGLYQCKQIVEAHGGRIEVESREGQGTVFTVVLPGKSQQPS